jgi:hypothetical protein
VNLLSLHTDQKKNGLMAWLVLSVGFRKMKNIWGDLDNNILYTTNDLVKVAKEYRKNGGIRTHKQYKSYLTKFTTLLNYLVSNQHLHKKEDASILLMQAFSPENQMNVKQTLVGYELLPKAPDRSTLPPCGAISLKQWTWN